MSLEKTLKEYRDHKSVKKGIPPYCIFQNKDIQSLCEKLPHTLCELITIKGFGLGKVQEYGEDILNICAGDDIGTPLKEEQCIMPEKKPREKREKSVCYGVAIGKVPGVYDTWSEVKEQVSGYSGSKHKGFSNRDDAQKWLESPEILNAPLTPNELPPGTELSVGQAKVIECIDKGENVFMSGQGGTGKSFLIQVLVERYQSVKPVQVCALTGVAAELLGCKARTIHSWSKVGIAWNSKDKVIEKTLSFSKNLKIWRNVDILIIDEVSMMSQKLFEILDAIGRGARNPNLPFGGIQLLFSGDFYQLPPVPDKEDPDSGKFCFESSSWSSTFSQVILLQQNFRQSDPTFMKVLRQVRRGGISENTYNILKQRIIGDNTSYEEGEKPTIIYPKRYSVKQENERNMEKIQSEVKTYESECNDDIPEYLKRGISEKYMEYAKGQLESQMNAEQILHLKVGSHVMCVAKISMEGDKQLVNGSQGVVEWFTEGSNLPVVKFKNGLVTPIGKHTWLSEEIEGLSIKQIPLILSWAITIHKSQGVTLDSAMIDAGNDVFECGQTYVALSRVKSLAGIFLMDLDIRCIKVNPKVSRYYASL